MTFILVQTTLTEPSFQARNKLLVRTNLTELSFKPYKQTSCPNDFDGTKFPT
ncbi:hypothetical protein GIB67_002046 [Kingdonia uniflora]|uniref:Uncharacterized protein n=1 Tax=Kingdonia uniflora TaxID=39325 RepID=A0A7J7KW89_9MAGN|nr:hypothetical protein GIB67_002046 [Kingdonia uniflora]